MTIHTHSTCIYADPDLHCYKEITNGLISYSIQYQYPNLNSECGFNLKSIRKDTEQKAMASVNRIRKRIDKVYAEWDRMVEQNEIN